MTTTTSNMSMIKGEGADNANTQLLTNLNTNLDTIDAHRHTGTTSGLTIQTGGLADDAVTAAKIADDVVTTAHLGDQVPAVIARQGGNASTWAFAGTTSYTPAAVRMQAGQVTTNASGTVTVTFPTAFSQIPLIWLTAQSDSVAILGISVVGASNVLIVAFNADGSGRLTTINWLAIGPE